MLDAVTKSVPVQSTWPTITAATAEKSVMPRAVRGFCPWATAKLVTTPAPRQATTIWVAVEGRSTGQGTTEEQRREPF